MSAPIRRLVGRERELAAAVGLLDERGEAPDVAVLCGEAGIGKTSVWLAALEEANRRGYRVLSTRPSGVEAAWSFAGLDDLLGKVGAEVLPHLPAVQGRALEGALLLGEPGRVVDERTVAAATLGALRLLAEERPVLVAVDDVQWLDSATLAALRFALPRLEPGVAAALFAVRGTPPEWLQRLVTDERLCTVEVGALSLGATHELLRRRLDVAFSRSILIRIWETSRGNPFFALELAAALRRRGGVLAAGQDLPVPTNLDALLSARLDGLGADALEVAHVVAALAEPSVRLAESAVERFDVGLGEALAAQILEVDGERLRFAHPLLEPVVAARLTPSLRRALHARLAVLVPTSEERARHLALATSAPDGHVAATLEEAARGAHARGAQAAAAELAERAVELTPPMDGVDAGRRLLFAAQRYHKAGDADRAASLLEEALTRSAPGTERAAVLVEMADVAFEVGERRAVLPLYRRALDEAAGDHALEARIHTDLAEMLSWQTSVEDALEHARLAVDAAARSGDVALACCARAVEANLRLTAGRGLDRTELDQALALERTLPEWPLVSGPTEYGGWELMCVGEFEAARALLLELHAAQRARQQPGDEAWALFHLSFLEWHAGNWTAAEQYATEVVELQTQIGIVRVEVLPAAVVAAHRGSVERARELARTALASVEEDGMRRGQSNYEWVIGSIERSLRNDLAALPHLRRAYELRNALVFEPAQRPELADLLEALVAVGALDEAEEVLEDWEPRAAALDRASALAILARARGLLLAARGDLDGSFPHFERALVEHARSAQPFQHARTLLALGRTQRRAKRRAAARGTLNDALARFDSLGARLWAEQTRSELARIGGRGPAGNGLTQSEQKVAQLVAEGKTNREVAAALFVTEHSVENALTRIYRKLDVRSRAELAARSLASP